MDLARKVDVLLKKGDGVSSSAVAGVSSSGSSSVRKDKSAAGASDKPSSRPSSSDSGKGASSSSGSSSSSASRAGKGRPVPSSASTSHLHKPPSAPKDASFSNLSSRSMNFMLEDTYEQDLAQDCLPRKHGLRTPSPVISAHSSPGNSARYKRGQTRCGSSGNLERPLRASPSQERVPDLSSYGFGGDL